MKFRRTILKQDLAVQLYPNSINPNAAMQALRREIRVNPGLKKRLHALGGKAQQHCFTHRQLLTLLEHFCITLEEFNKL